MALRADGHAPAFEAIRERLSTERAAILALFHSWRDGRGDPLPSFSFLHDAGRLTDAITAPAHVRDAPRSCVAVVDQMAAEVGGEPSKVNVMVCDGGRSTRSTAARRWATRVFAGKAEADALIGEDLGLRRKTPELSQMHFTLLASGFDEDFSLAASTPLRTRDGTRSRNVRS